MHEWPLLIFTLSMQTAVGAFCFIEWMRFKDREAALAMDFNRRLLGVVGVMAVGMAASFLHLGTPGHAFYALSNLKSSWMSREIFMASLFMGSVFIYTLIRLKGLVLPRLLTAKAAGIGLIGLALIYTMARLYMFSTVPAWKSWHTVASFFLTALTLGPLAVWLTLSMHRDVLSMNRQMNLARSFALFGLGLGLVVSALWLMGLSQGNRAAQQSLALLKSDYLYAVIGAFVLKTAALGLLLIKGKSRYRPCLLWVLFVITLAAEVLARVLFYVSYVQLGM